MIFVPEYYTIYSIWFNMSNNIIKQPYIYIINKTDALSVVFSIIKNLIFVLHEILTYIACIPIYLCALHIKSHADKFWNCKSESTPVIYAEQRNAWISQLCYAEMLSMSSNNPE